MVLGATASQRTPAATSTWGAPRPTGTLTPTSRRPARSPATRSWDLNLEAATGSAIRVLRPAGRQVTRRARVDLCFWRRQGAVPGAGAGGAARPLKAKVDQFLGASRPRCASRHRLGDRSNRRSQRQVVGGGRRDLQSALGRPRPLQGRWDQRPAQPGPAAVVDRRDAQCRRLHLAGADEVDFLACEEDQPTFDSQPQVAAMGYTDGPGRPAVEKFMRHDHPAAKTVLAACDAIVDCRSSRAWPAAGGPCRRWPRRPAPREVVRRWFAASGRILATGSSRGSHRSSGLASLVDKDVLGGARRRRGPALAAADGGAGASTHARDQAAEAGRGAAATAAADDPEPMQLAGLLYVEGVRPLLDADRTQRAFFQRVRRSPAITARCYGIPC